MAERGPLRDGSHVNQSEWNADAGPEHQGHQDPFVVDDAVAQQSSADGQNHAHLARPYAMPGRGGRAQPLQRQDEKSAGDQVDDFDDGLISGEVSH